MPKPKSLQNRLEWVERIRLQNESGASVKQWCREHQVSSSAFYYWKGVLRQIPLERSSFTELSVASKSSIILEYHHLRIHLENDFDASALKRCFHVLKEELC